MLPSKRPAVLGRRGRTKGWASAIFAKPGPGVRGDVVLLSGIAIRAVALGVSCGGDKARSTAAAPESGDRPRRRTGAYSRATLPTVLMPIPPALGPAGTCHSTDSGGLSGLLPGPRYPHPGNGTARSGMGAGWHCWTTLHPAQYIPRQADFTLIRILLKVLWFTWLDGLARLYWSGSLASPRYLFCRGVEEVHRRSNPTKKLKKRRETRGNRNIDFFLCNSGGLAARLLTERELIFVLFFLMIFFCLSFSW